jgi:uncharacterized cupredoxin-like copper-binding protein
MRYRSMLILAAGAAALAGAGCGGGSSNTASNTTPAAAATTAATTTAATTPAATTPTSKGRVAITLKEFTITPTPTSIAAGEVTFAVHNAGSIPHEFVVIATNKPAADLLKGNEADEAGSVGEVGELPAGASNGLTVKLRPGHYAFICNLPGHYASGQHVDFTVQ